MLIARTVGFKQLDSWLGKADKALNHTVHLYRTMGNIVLQDSFEAFATQSWHGEQWAPLAPATVAQRDRAGNILHPTGAHIMNTLSIVDLRDDYVKVGTPNPWAHVHNAGATLVGTAYGTITLPKRTFIGLDEVLWEKLEKALGFWLDVEVLG